MKHRPSMIGSEIRKIIAPVLRECPEECGVVTITAVRVSDDASSVRMSISALRKPDAALAFLRGEASRLRKGLSCLALRRVPLLHFVIDDTSERGARMDALLAS